jgi:hypothetical protein
VAPTYWLDTSTGVSHLVNIQTPQDQLKSINDLELVTVDKGNTNPANVQPQLAGGLSTITQTGTPGLVSHDAIMPVIDIYANVDGRDLGAVSDAVARVVKDAIQPAARGHGQHQRPGHDDALCLRSIARRPGLVDRADLPGDCRQLPVLA